MLLLMANKVGRGVCAGGSAQRCYGLTSNIALVAILGGETPP